MSLPNEHMPDQTEIVTPVHGVPSPAALPPLPPSAPRRPVPWAAITLIVIAVIGLGAVGYLAWQRGLLDGVLPQQTTQSPVKVVVPAESGDAAAGDPLDKLNDDVAGVKPYRHYAEVLRALDAELDATHVETDSPGVLAESTRQRLNALQEIGNQFTRDYEDFEKRAARDSLPKLQPYQEIVRKGFLERMQRFVDVIGEAYAAEEGMNYPVYTMSDTFIAAVKQYGRADPEPLREHWLAAVHNQEQRKLAEKFAPQLKELQSRIEKLKELHRQVNELLEAAPQYHIRGGIVGATARNLLDIYDSLADRVETQVVEFEQYTEALPAEHGSDELKAKLEEFTKLAQEDHFYAFRETYKIYEQDKVLEHPAYTKLKNHFEWVKQHWPNLTAQYEGQARDSEGRWDKSWAGL